MRRRATRALIAALLLVTVSPIGGDAQQDATPSKSQYNLFRRTPRELRRPLTTDRPDRTESPYTVDAGVFQVEIDVFTYGVDASTGGESGVGGNSFAIMPFNMKAGLLHNVDLQVVIETWAWNQETVNGTTQRQRGLGAVTVRTKVNLWGNDGGRTALAMMPFVAFVADPGASQRLVNLGMILPLRVDLGAGWGLGSMLQFELVRDGADAPRRREPRLYPPGRGRVSLPRPDGTLLVAGDALVHHDRHHHPAIFRLTLGGGVACRGV